MIYYLSKSLEIFENIELSRNIVLPEILNLYIDTEYTQKINGMSVDCVGFYSNLSEYGLVFTDTNLDDLHPITSVLKSHNIDSKLIDFDLADMISELSELEESLNLFGSLKQLKEDFRIKKETGFFDSFLKKYSLHSEDLILVRKNKESSLDINPKSINVNLIGFFTFADLFKIGCEAWQLWLKTQQLSQYRSLKFMIGNYNPKPFKPEIYAIINNRFYSLKISLKDIMYRLPPREKSLKGQSITFNCKNRKIELRDDKLIEIWDFNFYEDMTRFKNNHLNLFLKYNIQDVFTAVELDLVTQSFLDDINKDFDLETSEIKDTTGSNVSKFIKDCIFKYFNTDNKEDIITLNNCLKNSNIETLQHDSFNDFGIQPFLTVGGLLYSRVARYPIIRGILSDLDLSSCYASAMSDLDIYLGKPVTITFPYKKYQYTLKEILEIIEEKEISKDAWFVRVSGNLEKGFNTLIYSDLRFTNKKVSLKTFNDKKKNNPKLINQFNLEKIAKETATSTMLLKEIKFGLINYDLLESLKLLPEDLLEEYLNLKVDCLVYYPNELIADNLDDYYKLLDKYPTEPKKTKLDRKTGLAVTEQILCQDNVTLRFPIKDIWQLLKAKRSEYKKAKDPIQEVFKLFQNSGYGVLACLYLSCNNLMASNQITAKARSATWLMTNFLNGFNPITDGSVFAWENIGIGYTFKDILNKNPYYLFEYDDTIRNDLASDNYNQIWINKHFKKELSKFYQIEENSYLIQRFDYELKEETFTEKNGQDIKTTLFNVYYNTNSGNYIKGLADSSLLIDGFEYDFNSQENYIKARSFRSNDNLINFFKSSLEERYLKPCIYEENTVIKLGLGNSIIISFFNEDSNLEELAHPMGFSYKSFKLMKLITRSQFLFLNEKQLINFETNQLKLSELSKIILDKAFWDNLNNEDLQDYDCTMRENINYLYYNRLHCIGLGYELLSLSKKYSGDIKAIRNLIQDKILEGQLNFNACLNIDRNFNNLSEDLKMILAVIIIKKKNALEDLKTCLISSVNKPCILSVKRDEIKRLLDLWSENIYD